MLKINEIQCKEACNKLNRENYFHWDLNIYRGCQHGCVYCFAMYSHEYLNSQDYFENIYVKTNIVEQLEKLLSKPSWNREVINIGGVTDSYQPLEAKYKFMPDILKLLIKYKTPCNISTKSDLVLRDYELIDKLASITYVNVAGSIISLDENIRKKIEPNGKPYKKRFEMLKEFSKTNASTGVHMMPILPYITDNEDNLEKVFYMANDSGVKYIITRTLNLRGRTRGVFFDFIRKEFPYLFDELTDLYKDKKLLSDYKINLLKKNYELKEKYNLTDSYEVALNDKILKQPEYSQLSLLDL